MYYAHVEQLSVITNWNPSPLQTTMTMEENTLVHDQKGDKEKAQKDSVIRRTFDADTMTTVSLLLGRRGSPALIGPLPNLCKK